MELALDEIVLHATAFLGLELGVVEGGAYTDVLQLLRELLRPCPAVAVDDAALPRVAPNDAFNGLPPVLTGQHGEREVGAVEAAYKDTMIVQTEAAGDILAHSAVGRGGERDNGHLREALLKHTQVLVLRAERMAPGADAVRLIHRE